MHSTLLQLGPITIKAFGLMMALGFVAAWLAAVRLSRGTHRNADYIASLLVWMMVAGVVGARLGYVAEHWTSEFASHPAAIIRIDQGGVMFYGGLIGAGLVLVLWTWQHHEHLLDLSDLLSVVLPLGHAFGRVGCFLNGCCHGRVSDSPFAVVFPAGSPAWNVQCDAGLISPSSLAAKPVLPTQLFESGANLLIFLFLYQLYRRTPGHRGLVTGVYFMAYSVVRFLIEPLRGDVRMSVGAFSIGQAISVALFFAGSAILIWSLLKPAPRNIGA
jgi:phosphatidylglycerol:prolipoprotein diacylglycerol transferase